MRAELYFRVFQRSWSTIWPPLRTRTNRLSFDAHRNCTRVAPVIPRSRNPLNLPPQLRERDPHHHRIRPTPLRHLASLSDHQWKKRTLFQRYERSSSTSDAKACITSMKVCVLCSKSDKVESDEIVESGLSGNLGANARSHPSLSSSRSSQTKLLTPKSKNRSSSARG